MDFRNRHIVITGGAGALGTAVVEALIAGGAMCHVPCMDEAEAKRFRLRDHKQAETLCLGFVHARYMAHRAACDERFDHGGA